MNNVPEDVILEGFLRPEFYSGFKGKIVPLESKWYCNDRRYFWSLKWDAKLDDVDVQYDPANPDITTINITLKDSSLRAMYYRKDGPFCTWNGGEGVISAQKIFGTVSIHATLEENGTPEFSLDKLRVSKVAIRDVEVLYATIFSKKFRDSSDGFAEWVEKNINSITKTMLSGSIKKRINKAINDAVRDAVDEHNGPVIERP